MRFGYQRARLGWFIPLVLVLCAVGVSGPAHPQGLHRVESGSSRAIVLSPRPAGDPGNAAPGASYSASAATATSDSDGVTASGRFRAEQAQVVVPTKFNPGHYVMVYPSTSPESMRGFLSRSASFRGIGKEYDWSAIEPKRGVYDFTSIERDLNYLGALNKKLIVVIRPNAFGRGERHVPAYVTGPEFGGGVYVIRYTNYLRAEINTYGPVLWNGNVRDRLIALMRELARFDAHPALEAIQVVDESAVKPFDPSLNPDVEPFDLNAYIDNLTLLATETRKAFVHTQTLLGFNYPSGTAPDALALWAEQAQASGFGLAAPDVLLSVPSLTRYSYTYFQKLRGAVPLHATVDWMDYEKASIADMYAFARADLAATHIRWQARNDAPGRYFDRVVEMINSLEPSNAAGGLYARCPTAYAACRN